MRLRFACSVVGKNTNYSPIGGERWWTITLNTSEVMVTFQLRAIKIIKLHGLIRNCSEIPWKISRMFTDDRKNVKHIYLVWPLTESWWVIWFSLANAKTPWKMNSFWIQSHGGGWKMMNSLAIFGDFEGQNERLWLVNQPPPNVPPQK